MLTNTERQQIVEEVNAGTYGIDEALDDIAAAQKGEEVRKALYAEALVLNREGHAGSTDMIARQQIANLQTSVNGQISTLRTEVGEDIDDLETALNNGLATQDGKIAAQNASIANVVANYNVEYGSTELWASTGETGALAAGTTVTLSEDVSHFDYIDIYSFCGNSNVLDTVPVDAKLQSSQGYALRWVNLSDPGSGSYKAYVRIIETRLHIIGTTLTIDHQVTYRNGEEVNISGAEITQSNRSTYVGELGIMKIVGRKITANTEIEDVRIGADGTEYNSAGQAVRAQVTALESAIPAVDSTLSTQGAAADAKVAGDKVAELKNDLNDVKSAISDPYFNWTKKFPTAAQTSHGVTFTYVSEGVYDISGTATGNTFRNLVIDDPVEPGDIYTFSLSGGVPIRIYINKSDSSSELINFTKDGEYSLLMPSDAVSIIVRWQISSGSVYTPTVRATLKMNKRNPAMGSVLFPIGDNTDRTAEIERVLSKYCKCNFQKGRYYVRNVKMPNNSKVEGIGMASEIVLLDGVENLWSFPINQTFTNYKEFDLTLPAGQYTFKADVSSADTDASVCCVCFYYQEPFSSANAHYTNIERGTGKTITLDAEQPIIHLELLASDTFTHSTGDTGTFNNISLYAERTAAFVLGDECCVQNLKLMGDLNAVTRSADGFRDGVLYAGLGSNTTIHKGIVSGCFMANFTGGCITLVKTGYSSSGGLNISDCYLTDSYAGINIPLWSEFHRISNCSCTGNKYGVVNNGGNNEFTGCNFSSNTYGFVMDNSDSTRINDTHGGVSGCILQHNTLRAIYANRVSNGFIFEGCNIDNGGAELDHVTRIIFDSCNFMDAFELVINGVYHSENGLILFSSSMFTNTFTGDAVSIADNPYVRFNSCYKPNGSIVNPVS